MRSCSFRLKFVNSYYELQLGVDMDIMVPKVHNFFNLKQLKIKAKTSNIYFLTNKRSHMRTGESFTGL